MAEKVWVEVDHVDVLADHLEEAASARISSSRVAALSTALEVAPLSSHPHPR